MNRKLVTTTGLVILPVFFIIVMIVINQLSGYRADLTSEKLFTLSKGTKNIIQKIDEPIKLTYFFSEKASKDIPQVRTYAKRVEEFLQTYVDYSEGKIVFEKVDPEAFSEAEDQAAQYGLQSFPIDELGTKIYFGLAGTNAVDGQEIIPFFQPDKENTLEYDISKFIYSLSQPEKSIVGIMSSLPIFGGGFNPLNQNMQQAWYFIDQLEAQFDVRELATDLETIEEGIGTLIVVHPAGLPDNTLYAIDQFVLRGGNLLTFVDPLLESGGNSMAMSGKKPPQNSSLGKLFDAWGVEFDNNQVITDKKNALTVRMRMDSRPMMHVAMLSIKDNNLNQDDITTKELNNLHVRTAGVLRHKEGSKLAFTPLATTSKTTMLYPSAKVKDIQSPDQLLADFKTSESAEVIAARLHGNVGSAFTANPDKDSKAVHLTESKEPINVIVVADVDMLADDMWVRLQNFLGYRIPQLIASNGDFVVNSVDNLSGSNDLIGIRSQGIYNRPFVKVQALQLLAEDKFRAKERELRARLEATEEKLRQMQKTRENSQSLVLTEEQKQALIDFKEEKLRIRKELRNVQHALNKDIENLGTTLKVINIGVTPLSVLFLALFVRAVRLRKRFSVEQGVA